MEDETVNNAKRIHVLIIPSEQFVPDHEPLAGIFQRNDLDAFGDDPRFAFGVVSVRLRYSVAMFLRASAYRVAGKRVDNALGDLKLRELFRVFWRRLFGVQSDAIVETVSDTRVVRTTGLYFLPPSASRDHVSWVSAGLAAYRAYVSRFGRPDVVHAHNALNAGLLAAKIRARFGVPFVLSEHSSAFHRGDVPKTLFARIRQAIETSSRHVVVSPAVRSALEMRLGRLDAKSDVVANVLPSIFAREDSAPRFEKSQDATFAFLCVANLLPVKGHKILIRAFGELASCQPDVVLRLAGNGPLRDKLMALAKEVHVADKVSFLGELSREDVRLKMNNADALVVSSLHETFGVVLIEAMACGLPVVSTRCGGPDSIVTSECGVLVEPDSVTALETGMAWAIENAAGLDKRVIRSQAIERFGKERFARQLGKMYESVVRG